MIDVRELEYFYNANRKVLERVSFTGESGMCTAVLGNNGAGKSTLLKCINRILVPKNGSALLDGSDVFELPRRKIAQSMAYVAQSADTARFTVYDAVLLGRKPYISVNPTAIDYTVTERVLERLGLTDMQLRYIDELSGGELQKVMLARALAQGPSVLLLDEPTGSLDLRNQYEILTLVRELTRSSGLCAILVIHDLNLALRFCDRFVLMKNNTVFACGGSEVMTAANLESVYGIAVALEIVAGTRIVVPIGV
jgi:iron complex transport system ATP-binding protein